MNGLQWSRAVTMGDNVDQNKSTTIELMQHLSHLLNNLQQDSRQQYQAPEPPTLGDLNRPYMFYRDHQNLYYERNYVEDLQDESHWGYEAPYQPMYEGYEPLEPEYQEPCQLQSDTSLDDLNALMQKMITNEQRSIAKADEMIERWNNKDEYLWSFEEELDTPSPRNVKDIERVVETIKVINLNELDELSDLVEFNHAGTKDEETFSSSTVVLSDQSIPELDKAPPHHVYVTELPYPFAPHRPKVSPHPKEAPTANPAYHDYELKVLENCFSSVGFSTNEKQWYDEPTRHTMPWFEEVAV